MDVITDFPLKFPLLRGKSLYGAHNGAEDYASFLDNLDLSTLNDIVVIQPKINMDLAIAAPGHGEAQPD